MLEANDRAGEGTEQHLPQTVSVLSQNCNLYEGCISALFLNSWTDPENGAPEGRHDDSLQVDLSLPIANAAVQQSAGYRPGFISSAPHIFCGVFGVLQTR